MMKSLFAGAAALALIASSAIAQQAYDSSTTRTTTVTQPAPAYDTSTTRTTTVTQQPTVIAPPIATTTTIQRTVQPQYAPPPVTSSSREEHVTTQDGQTVEHTVRSNTATPYGSRSTTYSQTTQPGDQ
jgi:hypothetical protein